MQGELRLARGIELRTHVNMQHIQSNRGNVYYRIEERDMYQQQYQQPIYYGIKN